MYHFFFLSNKVFWFVQFSVLGFQRQCGQILTMEIMSDFLTSFYYLTLFVDKLVAICCPSSKYQRNCHNNCGNILIEMPVAWETIKLL